MDAISPIEPCYKSGAWQAKARKLARKAAKKQNNKCFWCCKDMNDKHNHRNQRTAEHLIPRSMGGKNTEDNVVAAHGHCNRRRGAKFPSFDEILTGITKTHHRIDILV